ncbi:MAG: DNA translocase FtsK [Clostridia bacterium]|nr:DNA translocase FtsK [Clostridia bacterium]
MAKKKTTGTTAERYQVKKKTTSSASKKQNKTTAVALADNTVTPKKKKTAAPAEPKKPSIFAQLLPYIFFLLAVFITVCLIWKDKVGVVGGGIHDLIFGLFGGASLVVPVFMVGDAIMWRRDREEDRFVSKLIISALCTILIAVLIHEIATSGGANESLAKSFKIVTHWENGVAGIGGGIFGGMLGALLLCAVGRVGLLLLAIVMLILLVLLFFNLTPRKIWLWIAYRVKLRREKKAEERAREAEARALEEEKRYEYRSKQDYIDGIAEEPQQIPLQQSEPEEKRSRRDRRRHFEPDVPVDDPVTAEEPVEEKTEETPAEPIPKEELIDAKLFDEIMARTLRRGESSGSVTEADKAAEQAKLESESVLVPEKAETEQSNEALPDDEVLRPVYEQKVPGEEDGSISDIFVDPEDKLLIDRLTAAYLSGDSSEISTESEKSGGTSEDAEDAEMSVSRRTVREVKAPPKPKRLDNYRFPPIDLLYEDLSEKDENIKDELYENAAKLVETLRSFNVKTKIVDVSRGPTITRYELLPEAGTRVRSIANLVDDIALNLATSGIRIEAPIPGKAAVGIEVPNRNPAVVHLRTLLEDSRFTDHKSRVCAALGEDVAGAYIYCDIAKMPHLLIAGATGMGKSVCINSVIVSLLYKSSPDDVRLILVDPKKVELNIYNGIPHLLTPVVSDPKKAAGSLAWAVAEMERRFALIEQVGVRDLKTFNEVTKDDPAYEYLPQIVIIIDELADLMMTAPDDVETSICRLAQKARAAGMHLIIGTQRPSVDVITGLIKANIPSRIAFTVASQIDSRTIIDRSGAENLIGRGDMLYNPVGAQKPLRVQGAFVSESDVEKVVDYIKQTSGVAQYDQSVSDQIEAEAARCGSGKKGAAAGGAPAEGEDAGAEDPMLRQAIELAVDSGKISTSLIQRRLSLGYGRAAKLIDRMEQLGYVSAPDGQKPREVLITKEQFMEMVVRGDGAI